MTAAQPLAGERLSFLLSLVPYLLGRGRVGVDEVATHFGVPPARVRATVQMVAVSGIPGETHTYLPPDLFDIDWEALEEHDEIEITQHVVLSDSPRFSAREAAALIAGLQYIQAMPTNADDGLIAALTAKLSRGTTTEPPVLAVNPAPVDEALTDIRRALATARRITFSYRNETGHRTQRSVDPWQLDSLDSDWYLRGWDHEREATRTFRLDRLDDVTVTDSEVSHPQGGSPLSDRLFDGSPEHPEVTLEVSAGALELISDYVDDEAEPEFDGDRARVSIRVAHYAVLGRLVGAHPGQITVVGDDRARHEVAVWAHRALENYADATQFRPSSA